MGCCSGSCSCGKGEESAVQENLTLVQMPTSQGKMATHDWMKGLGALTLDEEVVEIRFKNNRKAFFRNSQGISLAKDDRVVVEVEGGHDLGTVSLSGALAERQFAQKSEGIIKSTLTQIYRRATPVDVEKWLEAKRREREVLLQSRAFATELHLEMSISDVEFRGDGRKVTIYYTADQRVDFREFISKYAMAFGVNIEMRQIGVRQSAAKVRGMGTFIHRGRRHDGVSLSHPVL